MAEQEDTFKLRSEEVQEILTAVPHWLIRWGNLVCLLLVLLLIAISYFVAYPDTVPADIVITTHEPPQKAFAQKSGRLDTVFVSNNQSVAVNQPLAVMANAADYQDVYQLKSILDTLSVGSSLHFPIDSLPPLSLGEIEVAYAFFQHAYRAYQLNNQRVSRTAAVSRLQEENDLFNTVIQSLDQLKRTLNHWEQRNVFTAQISGVARCFDGWEPHEFVEQGDLVVVVIPDTTAGLIAKAKIMAQNRGKVKANQTVNIRLQQYPEETFGTLKGTVASVSSLPDQEGRYTVEVHLPNPLITSHEKELSFQPDMLGSADIVTEDLRLIDRFFHQLRSSLSL